MRAGGEPSHPETFWPARAAKVSRFTLLFLFLLAGFVAWSGWTFWRYDQDDAFITYRYAQQIARGNGFVYNLNEPVLGTTTPLFTLLLAGISALSGAGVRDIGHAVSIAALFAGGFGLYFIGMRKQRWMAAVAAFLYVTNPLYQMSVGMETYVFVSLLIFAILAYQMRWRIPTALLLGLAIVVRYEAALLALMIGLHSLWHERRTPHSVGTRLRAGVSIPWWLAWSFLPVLPWLIFAWRTFGQIIPHSAFAKLSAAHIPFFTGLLVWLQVYNISPLFLAFPLLALLGVYHALRNRALFSSYHLLFAWSLVYGLICGWIAGSFPWYYGPLIPALAVLCAGGLQWVSEGFSHWLRRPTWSAILLSILAVPIIFLQCLAWRQDGILQDGRVMEGRTLGYRQVIDWLKKNAPPGSSLAVAEIGVIGYDTDMRIVDLYGLVTTGLEQTPSTTLARRVELAIKVYAPDYILVKEDKQAQAVLAESGKYRIEYYFTNQRQSVLYERIP